MDLDRLPTEQHRPELADLDLRPTLELVKLMAEELEEVREAVAAAAPAIAAAIEAVVERLAGGGRLVYVGAGTAGRLGLLDAAECPPTFNTEQVTALLAGGAQAFLEARGEAEDDEEAGAAAVEALGVSNRDAVVGVTASGRTPYTVGALARARALGALTVGISSNPDAELSRHVDHAVEVATGPEMVAGSTRLKAGTAQKTVLNMISTIAMVRLGKTFGNLMVDLRATNAKLRARARRMVRLATGAAPQEVERALAQADGEVKVAILMLLAGLEAGPARDRLAAHGGVVRRALEAP